MLKVGCCGFPTSMNKYFEAFCLVELNNTFYNYPRRKTVEGWRQKAPSNFEFTVKAHQDISHKARLTTGELSLQGFERMKEICKILGSRILLVQTPGSFNSERLAVAEQFFRDIDRGDLILVWETRGTAWEDKSTYKKLSHMLERTGVGHVTDPFNVKPAFTSEIVYFRVHGLGKKRHYYQYSDSELQRLGQMITRYEAEGKEVYVFFNNLSMFEDARRFKQFLSTGVFPKMTSSSGLQSIEEIVAKTRFPVSKSFLIGKLGWRLVEAPEGKQTRLEEFLKDLSSKDFNNLDDLLRQIRSAKKMRD